MAFQAGKLPKRTTVGVESAQESDGLTPGRVKLIVMLVLACLLIIAIAAGLLMSGGSGGAGSGATGGNPNAGTTPTSPQPPPADAQPPEGAARLVITVTPNDPNGNRLTFGPRTPFPIPGEGMADIDGGGVVGGQHQWARPQAGQAESGVMMLAEPDSADAWVRVKIDASIRKSLLGRSVDAAERVVPPILLVDGQQIGAVGFFYEDASQRAYMVETLAGMRGLAQAPQLVAARNDQTMWLLFRVPKGGYIRSLHYGKRKIVEWEQPVLVP